MAEGEKVVSLQPRQGDPRVAADVRAIADMIEEGAIKDIVIVYQRPDDHAVVRLCTFTDRLRFIGAIEHAKIGVSNVG